MQLSFLRLWFPSALVFSVLYHCDRSLCFNARAVAQKQWQMLENWRSHGFLKMRFVMQMSFLGLCFSSIIVFSETHDCIRRLCFNARAAVRNEREVLEEHQFFSKCVYQITEFSEVVIFNLSCVLRIQWIKQNYMFERTSGCTETTESPWETQEATFYQNEIYHVTKFSEIVIFKCPSVLRIVLLWQESVFLTHEWWPRNNGKYLKNWRSQFFSKRDLPCKWVFWSCEFSGVPVFSETHEFNKSLCFTLQAGAQKQR